MTARPRQVQGVVTTTPTPGASQDVNLTKVLGSPISGANPVPVSFLTLPANSYVTGNLTAAWDGITPSTPPAGSVLQITVPSGFSSWSVQLGGTFSSTSQVAFEGSEDNIYFFALNGRRNLDVNTNDSTNTLDVNPFGGAPPTGANPSHWRGTVGGIRYFRVRCVAYTAADNIAVGISSSEAVGAVFLNSIATVSNTPLASVGACSVDRQVSLTNSAILIKGSAARLYGYNYFNSGSALAYVNLYDAATAGAVTVGTTVPKMSFPLPSNANAQIGDETLSSIPIGAFSLGMVISATTTPNGSGAPATTIFAQTYFV